MSSFYEFITANNEKLKFEFTEVSNPTHPKYFINVFRADELVTSFEMKRNYSRWEIVQPAPGWVSGIRLQLIGIIENLRNKG